MAGQRGGTSLYVPSRHMQPRKTTGAFGPFCRIGLGDPENQLESLKTPKSQSRISLRGTRTARYSTYHPVTCVFEKRRVNLGRIAEPDRQTLKFGPKSKSVRTQIMWLRISLAAPARHGTSRTVPPPQVSVQNNHQIQANPPILLCMHLGHF